jgi:hypothetical protein
MVHYPTTVSILCDGKNKVVPPIEYHNKRYRRPVPFVVSGTRSVVLRLCSPLLVTL